MTRSEMAGICPECGRDRSSREPHTPLCSRRDNDAFPDGLEYFVDGTWVAESDLTPEQKAAWLKEVLL